MGSWGFVEAADKIMIYRLECSSWKPAWTGEAQLRGSSLVRIVTSYGYALISCTVVLITLEDRL